MLIRITLLCLAPLSLSACGTGHLQQIDQGSQGAEGATDTDSRGQADDRSSAGSTRPESAQTTRRPYQGMVNVIPGVIEAEHYDEGEPDVAYHDNDEQNQGADYRGVTQVDIEQRDDASNGHGVGWTRTGEWLSYSVDIRKAGVYTVEFPVASNKRGGVFHLEIDGEDVTGPIEVPDTGGWGTLEVITATTGPLKEGRCVLQVFMDSQGESGSIGDIDSMRFIPQP